MGNFGLQPRISSPFGTYTDDDAEILREALTMVLNTARGTLRLDPEYGFLVSSLCNKTLSRDAAASIPGEIEAAVQHLTDMVSSCSCKLVSSNVDSPQGVQLEFELSVEPNTGGPWVYNVSVDALSAEVMRSGA